MNLKIELLLVGIALGLIIGLTIGLQFYKQLQQNAVKNGVAEWQVIDTGGNVKFFWKNQNK